MERQFAQETRSNLAIVWISRVMAAISAVTLGIMVIIAVVDVCGRFFFKYGLQGGVELGGILLVIAGTWGMGYCQLRKQNIRIDVLVNRFPEKGRTIAFIFTYIICVLATGLITWRSAVMTQEYMHIGLGTLTPTLLIPYWPFMLMMTVGFGWFCVILIIDSVNSIKRAVER